MKEAIIQYNDTPSGGHLAISWEPLVRCKDCKNVCMCDTSEILPGIPIYAKCTLTDKVHKPDWFCADGKRK